MGTLNPLITTQALTEGGVCSDVAHFPCPVSEIPLHPIPQSCTNQAWLLSLALSWNSAASSISSGGVNPFLMNTSLGGLPTGWGLWLLCFCLSCTLGVRRQQVFRPFLSITIMSSFSCSPHSQGFLLLVLQLDFVTYTGTFIQGHSHPPSFVEWHLKFSYFLSCSPTLSASPELAEQRTLPVPF